jgi:hypothetical protein
VSCIQWPDYNNNPMLISLVNKLYINMTRMPINKKETSYIIAFRLCILFKVFLKPSQA